MNFIRAFWTKIANGLNNYFDMLARQAETGMLWDDWS